MAGQDVIDHMRGTALAMGQVLREQLVTEDAPDEGEPTRRMMLALDGVDREGRDREALAQANASVDADAEVAHYQTKLEQEKADAFAANPLCIHCGKPVTDLERATYLPDLRRLAHHGQCGITALQQHWGHLLGGVHVAQESAA